MQRLFFALWPDAGLQRELFRFGQRLQTECGGRVVAARHIHLTLAFLGDIPSARIPELRGVMQSVSAAKFKLELARAGYWSRSSLAWIAPDPVAPELDLLVKQLRTALSHSDFIVDERPFAPHVTLVRNAKRKPGTDPGRMACEWAVSDFVLMRSRLFPSGPHYSELLRTPLL